MNMYFQLRVASLSPGLEGFQAFDKVEEKCQYNIKVHNFMNNYVNALFHLGSDANLAILILYKVLMTNMF